jgi:hypothetical protein
MYSGRFRGLYVLLLTLATVTLGITDDRAFSLRLPLEMRLKKRIAIDFVNTPLAEVIETLRKRSDIDIVVDEPALVEAGISRETPVSMTFEHIPVKSALQLTLHQVGLAWWLKDGRLIVTTEQYTDWPTFSLAHPVADLLLDKSWDDLPWEGPTRESKLIDLIRHAIEPASWSMARGKGTIEYSPLTLSLVVFQRRELQEQVAELLASLRRLQEEKFTPPPAAR